MDGETSVFDKGQNAVAMAETIRSMIRHENDLMNHRIQWLVTFQGLMFTALSFAWKEQEELVWLIAGVAFMSALSGKISLDDASKAIDRLKKWWECKKKRLADAGLPYKGPAVIGFDRLSGWQRKLVIWHLLPWVLMVTWFVLPILRTWFYSPGAAKP